MSPRVSAPGKVVLAGEYAVCHGYPAIVAAIQVRCIAQQGTPNTPSMVLDCVEQVAIQQFGANSNAAKISKEIVCDTEAFAWRGKKLGLGSSAAVSVAATAFVLLHQLETKPSHAQIFSLALMAHQLAQQKSKGSTGSGVDIAAATYGGIVAYTVGKDPTTTPALTALGKMEDAQWAVIGTGIPSSTAGLLQKVDAWGQGNFSAHEHSMNELANAAQKMQIAANIQQVIDAVFSANQAMETLGRRVGVPISTGAHTQITALARSYRGAAKPSGAGGGDISIAILPNDEYSHFCKNAVSKGFHILTNSLGGSGVVFDP